MDLGDALDARPTTIVGGKIMQRGGPDTAGAPLKQLACLQHVLLITRCSVNLLPSVIRQGPKTTGLIPSHTILYIQHAHCTCSLAGGGAADAGGGDAGQCGRWRIRLSMTVIEKHTI